MLEDGERALQLCMALRPEALSPRVLLMTNLIIQNRCVANELCNALADIRMVVVACRTIFPVTAEVESVRFQCWLYRP